MSKPPILIGLVGAANAGKDTAAAHLERAWAFERMAFAEPIQLMLTQLFATCGIDGAWAADRSLKEMPTPLGFSYRHLAQTLGTEWGRKGLTENLWTRVAEMRIDGTPELQGANIVFSDIRFPNEAAWIKSRGGYLVHVWRDPATRGATRKHESEQHCDEIETDTELINVGSIATLELQIDRMVEFMLKQVA